MEECPMGDKVCERLIVLETRREEDRKLIDQHEADIREQARAHAELRETVAALATKIATYATVGAVAGGAGSNLLAGLLQQLLGGGGSSGAASIIAQLFAFLH